MSKAVPKVYLSNIARRWKKAVEDKSATQILIFSPYMTSSTTESVLENVDPKACSLYTVFSAENFAHGSSSLRTVKRLHERGFRFYHLLGLHAKAVIVGKCFASIGSQNLTLQGTKNREASVIILSESHVAAIRRMFEQWAADAQVISSEMIYEMEKVIIPFQKMFRDTKRELAKIESEIFCNENNRIIEQQKKALQAELERQRLADVNRQKQVRMTQLSATIARLTVATTVIYGWVRQSKFLPVGNSRFTSWLLNGEQVELQRAYRYVCVLPDSGRFAWVRVLHGRLSFVQRALKQSGDFELNGQKYDVRCYATWPDDPHIDGNLSVEFSRSSGRVSMDCTMWFGIDSFIFFIIRLKI